MNYYSLKKPTHWLWRTKFTRAQVLQRLAAVEITGEWLICPLGEADKAITVQQFVADADAFGEISDPGTSTPGARNESQVTALPTNERIMTTDDNNEYVSDTTCFDNYGKGWKLIFSSFGVLFAVTLIYLVFRVPTDMMDDLSRMGIEIPGWLWLAMVPFAIFLLGPITMSYGWVFLKAVRYEGHRISDVFAVFKRNYWNAVGGGILKFVLSLLLSPDYSR